MTQELQNYTKALYGMDAVVRRMPADAWDNQSPCDEWCAREVLGHVMWGMKSLTATASGAERPAEQAEADVAGPDPRETWFEVRDNVMAALDQRGALQQMTNGPFGEMAVNDMLGIATMDVTTHTWDVAQSAGIEACCDETIMAQGQAMIAAMGDGLRRPGLMDHPVDSSSDADQQTRFANFMGRAAIS